MMPDIFSSFDPSSFSTYMPTNITMTIALIMVLMFQSSMWMTTRANYMNMVILINIVHQLMRTQTKMLKGLSTTLSALFLTLVLINLIGLNPYSMSLSSHLTFTLTIGLPLWLSMIISSILNNYKQFVAHFLPDGAPTWLSPALILIETTSITVRPITLSFRLAANMSAGHIVLGLIGLYLASYMTNSIYLATLMIITMAGYILFEVAICMIQAYIFCLLLSLYADDHSHTE